MRILFVSANRIGDAVITCGVIDSLIRRYPEARFTIACGPVAAGLFQRMPGLERIVLVDKRKNDSHWWRLWREVAFTVWDLAVDVRGSALTFVIPARRRVVRRKYVTERRMFEQHAAMLGIEPAPLPVVWTAPEDRARAAALIPDGPPVIAFGATANWGPKIWPADRFAALFQRLGDTILPGAVPAVFAGPGAAERALAAPLLAALPGAIDLCGTLTLPEASAAIMRCALYVGNDSGLTHLAAATGARTVGLYGTTVGKADQMSPAGRRAVLARAPRPSMDALSVDDVYAACETLLRTDSASAM